MDAADFIAGCLGGEKITIFSNSKNMTLFCVVSLFTLIFVLLCDKLSSNQLIIILIKALFTC